MHGRVIGIPVAIQIDVALVCFGHDELVGIPDAGPGQGGPHLQLGEELRPATLADEIEEHLVADKEAALPTFVSLLVGTSRICRT